MNFLLEDHISDLQTVKKYYMPGYISGKGNRKLQDVKDLWIHKISKGQFPCHPSPMD